MTRQEIDAFYRQSLLIVGSLLTGQLIYAAASFYIRKTDTSLVSSLTLTNPLTLAWIGLSLTSLIVAFTIRAQIADLADNPAKREQIRTGALTMPTLQTRILIMFAALEGAGLLGMTNYLINGHPQVLVASIAFAVITTVIFFPKRDWFDAFAS